MNDLKIANDQFWLEYGKSSIEKSISSVNESASKLETITKWFWTTYTTFFTIGISTDSIDAPILVLILLSLPIILLIMTYWFCVLAQMPVNSRFNPKIPSRIRKAYNNGVIIKKKRLRWALAATFMSALSLCTALFLMSFLSNHSEPHLDVKYDKSNSRVIISGSFPENTELTTTIDSIVSGNQSIQFYKHDFKVQEGGVLSLNVDSIKSSNLRVTTYWKEGKETIGITKLIRKK
ncbi:MAG: hypothetical protein ACJA1C_002172 [Crocinitomicaceae bacterium]|jgi:hypothetical protein